MRGPRPCPICGEIFSPQKVGGYWTKSCSRKCGNELTAQAMRNGGARKASAAVSRPSQVKLTCEVCGKEWFLPPSQVRDRRTCSRKCGAELKRRRGGSQRRGEHNPNWKNGSRVGVRDRAGERRWYAAAAKRCQNPYCEGGLGERLALHHIIYRQTVAREGGDLWDPRNALTLCASCHARHHRASAKIPLRVLPDSVFEFAGEVMGRGAAFEYLTRRYEGSDRRLAELLEESDA